MLLCVKRLVGGKESCGFFVKSKDLLNQYIEGLPKGDIVRIWEAAPLGKKGAFPTHQEEGTGWVGETARFLQEIRV